MNHDAQIAAIYDWVVDGAPGTSGPAELFGELCERVRRAGIPVDRGLSFVRTLHPDLMGRSFNWAPGRPTEVREASHEVLASPMFLDSPFSEVTRTARPLRRRLLDPNTPRDYEVIRSLESDGFTDYVAIPFQFLSGEVHVATFATRAPEGFDERHIAA